MSSSRSEIHVLHVDDEPDIADLAATYIERADDRFVVETETSAEAGLNRLARGDFDCVVSDYDMPGQNGIELLEAVRAEYADVPFILFTGKGSEEIASDAISAGVTDYLQKGPGTDQYTILANRIENAVEARRAERERTRMRERMELALEETNSVIFELNLETGTVSRHGAVEAFFDIDLDRIDSVEEFMENLVHPEDRERVREFYEHLPTSETDNDVIEYRTHPDIGSVRWLRDHTYVSRDADGAPSVFGLAQDITTRKQRERELETYEAYLEHSTDIFSILAADGTIKYESPSLQRILGYEPEEMVGENGFDYVHPDDVGDVWSTFEELVEDPDGTATVECRFRSADGEWRWLDVHGTNQLDNPAIEGIVTNNRDITERKEREQELERVQDFFTEAERLGDLGAWEVDASGNGVWTEGTRRIHEVDDATDLSIEDGIEFFHPEDRERIERAVERALEAGDPYDIEARIITATGNERWVRTRGQPVGEDDDDDGPVVRGYIQDITERKERELDLESAKSQLEAAIEAGNVATWEWHVPEDRLETGRTFARTFGVDPEAAREGVSIDNFLSSIHEEDRERVERQIEAALDACGDYEAEYRVWNGDDDLRWVVARGQVICDDDGTPQRFPGAIIDITELKAAERDLQRKNERLDELTSLVSHDLQNPLQVAEGQLALAREVCDSEHLDAVSRAHERMRTLIEDLLTLARQDAGDIERTSIPLEAFVDTCWHTVETNDATLSTEVDGSIRADEGRLQRLFENLFRNAVEHGGADVTITVGRLPDGFFVADDGAGIAADVRDDLFEAGVSTTSAGTGFGLAIVARVVDAHDWSIDATASDEGGARFEITGVEFVED